MGIPSSSNEVYSHYYQLCKAEPYGETHVVDMKDGKSARVPILLKRDCIKIGCAKVNVDVIQFILDKHKEKFGNDSFVI